MGNHASINRIYRLVWNTALNVWVAVAENARGAGKGGSGRSRVGIVSKACGSFSLNAACRAALLMLTALLVPQAYAANAADATVSSGAGSVATSGATTTITQASQRLAIDWSKLSTAAGESMVFAQPNAQAIALNRITGASASEFLGSLTANGQVFILNPNGVLFGAGSQVNVGGLVASTLSMSNVDFEAGNFRFSGSGAGSVVNQGSLTAAPGGYIALLAPEVRNEGVISATLGTALLAAGNKVTVNLDNGSLLGYSIDQGAVNALAENKHLIQANGGQVLLSARALDSLTTATVNNTGVIEAKTIQNKAGRILLMADMETGTVNVAGTLDASAPDSAKGGNGGFIETSGAHVKVADGTRVSTLASNGETGTWLIDPTDFTISSGSGAQTGSGIGASTLSSNLASSNITLATDNSSGTDSGDIHVNAAVSWSANKLTLNAYNNININANLNGSGSASLALLYGQGTVSGGTSNYNVKAEVNLAAGNNFSTQLGSTGPLINYTVITSLGAQGSSTAADLQGINAGLSGNYVLGANIDAADTATWNAGAGFAPIGTSGAAFTGIFTGLGHTISNLTINRPSTSYVGLFGYADYGSQIRDLGLVGGSVTGASTVGGLAGYSGSAISNSYTTGVVHGTDSSETKAGGLVGFSEARISNSYATGHVSGVAYAGGLVGLNNGSISNSYATGSVSGSDWLGGLVGLNYGSVSNSYATGSVIGSYAVGGLVGWNDGLINHIQGTISDSYATGNVSGSFAVGGLVGWNASIVRNSFWNSDISAAGIGEGSGYLANVVGLTTPQLQQHDSFAGWNMTDTWLIYDGHTNPLLRSFMTPLTVTANNVTQTYNGLAYSGSGGVSYSSTPNANLLGTLAYSGGTNAGSYAITLNGLYSMLQQGGYAISYVNGTQTVNPVVLNVSGMTQGGFRTYDGTTVLAPNGSTVLNGLIGSETLNLAATLASKNVGSQAITLTLENGTGGLASNYTLAPLALDNITVTPAPLAINAVSASKTYDGNTTSADAVSVGTLFGTDTVTATSQAFASKNVLGTNGSTLSVTAYAINDGNGGNNYSVTSNTATGTITPAALSLNAVSDSKTYDGSTTSTGAVSVGTLLGTDSMTAAVQTFGSKNVLGTNGSTLSVTAYAINDGNGGNNYSVTSNTATGTITPAALSLNAVSDSKTYDGSTTSTGAVSVGTLFDTDSVTAVAQTFGSRNVLGTNGSTLSVTAYTVNDGNDGNNYSVTSNTAAGTITPATLTVTGLTGGTDRVYDGTTGIALNGAAVFNGLVGGETLTLLGTRASKNVGSEAVMVTLANGTGLASNYTLPQLNLGNSTISRLASVTWVGGSSGNWSDAANWAGGATPDGANVAAVSIPAGASVTYDSGVAGPTQLNTLNIPSGNALNVSAGSLTVAGITTLGGEFDVSGTGNAVLNGALSGATSGQVRVSGGALSMTAAADVFSLTLSGGVVSAPAGLTVGTYTQTGGTWRQVAATLPGFSANDFHFTGGTFLRALGGDGSSATPYQLSDIYGVQGMASTGLLGNAFVLANNIDATGTANWSAGAGFVPIGNASMPFTGRFDGQSHTISNLTINRPNTLDVGMFGYAGAASLIENIGLVGGSISGGHGGMGATGGNVGALVGANLGVIGNSYATSQVSGGTGGTGNTGSDADMAHATIINGIAYDYLYGQYVLTAAGTGGTGATGGNVGGLAGLNQGTISNSYSAGSVSGARGGTGGKGGFGAVIEYSGNGDPGFGSELPGGNGGSGGLGGNVGGLVGQNRGQISNSYAAATVSGSAGGNGGTGGNGSSTGSSGNAGLGGRAGGLMGDASGTVSNSIWNTDVHVTGIGGGTTTGATGLTGTQMMQLASFTGWDMATTGGSTAAWRIYEGNTMPLLRSFLTPLNLAATTVTYNGGTQSGNAVGISGVLGSVASGRNAGLYTNQDYYSTQSGYDIAGGDLIVGKLALTGTITAGSSTYGSALSAGTASFSNVIGTDVVTPGTVAINTSGRTSSSGNLNAGSHAGVQTLTSISGADADNYSYGAVTGDYTVDQLALAGSIGTGNSTYGAALAAGTASFTNVVGGDVVTPGAVAVNTGGNTSSSGHLKAGSYTGVQSLNSISGADAGNYSYADVRGNYGVGQLALTGSIGTGISTYGSALTPGSISFGNAVSGDAVAAAGTVVINTGGNTSTSGQLRAGSHAGIQSINGSLAGADAGNYSFAGSTGDYTVNALNLHVSGLSAGSKVYDGSTNATVSTTGASYTGLITGDVVTVSATGVFADKNVGAGKTVALTSNYGGADAGNYSITGQASSSADITPRALTVSVTGVNKVYDGSTVATVAYADNRVAGDVLLISSTASFLDKNAGAGKAVQVSGIGTSSTDAGNYTLTSTAASTTADISKASLTVAANNDSKLADGSVYSGGNGVSYGGLVAGETSAVLGGALLYSGSSQGASTAGTYAITAGGLSSGNYALNYVNGVLDIQRPQPSPFEGTGLFSGGSSLMDGIYRNAVLSVASVGGSSNRTGSGGDAGALNAAAEEAGEASAE